MKYKQLSRNNFAAEMLYNRGRIFLILSFFVLYILSVHGLVRCIECRCSRTRGKDVTITDVTLKTPDRNRTGDVNDVMPGSDGLGFLVILNKSSELRFGLRRSELIFRTWARPVRLWTRGCARVFWVR